MNHRKGFPRIAKAVRPFTPDHPVAGSITRGSRWFDAWTAQMTTPYVQIAKKTGIAADRLIVFSRGGFPDAAEIEALAALWHVTPEGLRASICQCRDRRGEEGSA